MLCVHLPKAASPYCEVYLNEWKSKSQSKFPNIARVRAGAAGKRHPDAFQFCRKPASVQSTLDTVDKAKLVRVCAGAFQLCGPGGLCSSLSAFSVSFLSEWQMHQGRPLCLPACELARCACACACQPLVTSCSTPLHCAVCQQGVIACTLIRTLLMQCTSDK